MKTFKVNMYGKEVELYCKRFKYSLNQNTMIQLMTVDGQPYCALSTNPPYKMSEDVFYSCPNNYDEILVKMVKLKMIRLGNSTWRSGFNTYKLFEINEKIFSQYEKESL